MNKINFNFIKNNNLSEIKNHPLNLRITSLLQLIAIEKCIEKYRIFPNSIEFGEIINTKDLSRHSAFEIIDTVHRFCQEYNIKFFYSTPTILIERDFDRFFSEAKNFCLTNKPYILIINNMHFLEKFVFDKDTNNIAIGIGQGISDIYKEEFQKQNRFQKIKSCDYSDYTNFAKQNFKLETTIDNRYTICGFKEVEIKKNCLLKPNNKNGLNCEAPCQNGVYLTEIKKKKYYCLSDGFCRTHIFKQVKPLKNLQTMMQKGINSFIADLSIADENYIFEFFNQLAL